MGLVRYAVKCPGCESGIILRLAVGHDKRQPFVLVCPGCAAATRGALLWLGGAKTDLELSDGHRLTSDDDCKYTVHINPEFPSIPTAESLEVAGGSAFITFVQLLGDDLFRFQGAMASFRGVLNVDGQALQRLTNYYLRRDWTHFDITLSKLAPEELRNPTKDWQRDHAIHFLYDVLFAPLAVDRETFYPPMKVEWNALWSRRENTAALLQFADAEIQTQLFAEVQRSVFNNLEIYLANIGGLLPGLLCNMVPPEHESKIDNMRLFRDEYEVLRDLYIQTFESSHKALRWVLGAYNAVTHGDPNTFVIPKGTTGLKKPASLDAFGKLVNAEKRRWLSVLPEWDTRWDKIFDRHVRNDIGHASAHHELATGMILRENKPPLSYVRFVALAQRSVHGLLVVANAMKLMRIFVLMNESSSSA